jgi:hypothetical protein
MAVIREHGRVGYRHGCRCDQCKCAESAYQKDLRRRKAEAVADFAGTNRPELALVTGLQNRPLTCINGEFDASDGQQTPANSVVEAVQAEIDALGTVKRPGLAAAALALARILDNPRAISSQPPAAAKLADLLDQLRRNADSKRSKLAAVRALTSTNAAKSVG